MSILEDSIITKSYDSILYIEDIFFSISEFLDLKDIIKLELLSKYHKNIIRKYHFISVYDKSNFLKL